MCCLLVDLVTRIVFINAGTSIKLNADFGNGTMKPSSAEKEDGSNQVEPIKTSSSPQSSELQQQTNSSDGILCTAV